MRPAASVWLVAVCLAVTLVAGCTEPALTLEGFVNTPSDLQVPGDGPYPSSMAQIANLTLGDGGLTLHLGVGWGQLRITAGGISVDVEVDHETLEFGPFADMGNSVYGPGAFTAVRLEGTGDRSGDAEEFWWIGHDAGFSGPHGSSDGAAAGTLHAGSGGELVLLTVATNVRGYTLHIGHGGPALDWPLGPHEDLVAEWPEPTGRAGVDSGPVRAGYRREWSVPLPDLPPSAIYAYAWTSDFGTTPVGGTRWGLAWTGFGITQDGIDPPPRGPGPDGGFGGYFGGGMWDTRATQNTKDMQAALWYEQTDAGTTTTRDGLAVVAMPLQPA